jgi:hypothetical protein
VGQLSFYSAEAMPPCVADLGGLLCCQAQVATFARTAARLSVVVDEPWRAEALAGAFAERGVAPETTLSEDGLPQVRTAFRSDMIGLGEAWADGAAKTVPDGLALDGAALRLWALAAGRWVDGGYLLGLDPGAPETHEPIGLAVTRIGLLTSVLGERGGGPGLRVTGRRRLGRLVELVGRPPVPSAEPHWPVR